MTIGLDVADLMRELTTLRQQMVVLQGDLAAEHERGRNDRSRLRVENAELRHQLEAAQRTIDSGNEAFRLVRDQWSQGRDALSSDLAAARQRIAKLEAGRVFNCSAIEELLESQERHTAIVRALSIVYQSAADALRMPPYELTEDVEFALSTARAALTPELLAVIERDLER